MNLQPSTSTMFNERRALFSTELATGGHGQIYFSTAGTYTAPVGYVFYTIDFLTDARLSSTNFRNTNDTSSLIYSASNANYSNVVFPAGYSWIAPLASFTVVSGIGIAYMYKKFIPEELICQ